MIVWLITQDSRISLSAFEYRLGDLYYTFNQKMKHHTKNQPLAFKNKDNKRENHTEDCVKDRLLVKHTEHIAG